MTPRPAPPPPPPPPPSPPASGFWSRVARAPAVHAMLIQCGALPVTLFLLYLLDLLHAPLNYLTAALLQGAVATLITWKLDLASWWRPIQFLFPPGLLTANALQLPPALFLLLFLLLLGVYWSTFRTQVPYYPSNRATWDAVQRLLPQDQNLEPARPLAFIDIGSGLGGLVLHLARLRPGADCQGIELAPLPWLYSRLRARLSGSRARFLRGDYEDLDFSRYDVVFAYLSPAAMAGLWRKAAAEMRPGAMLLSYEFEIEARAPDQTIPTTEAGPPLYVWYF